MNLSKRLGNLRGGAVEVRSHKWFEGIEWLEMYHQRSPPPYTPPTKGPGDPSNYEEYEEEPIIYSTVNKFEKEFEQF